MKTMILALVATLAFSIPTSANPGPYDWIVVTQHPGVITAIKRMPTGHFVGMVNVNGQITMFPLASKMKHTAAMELQLKTGIPAGKQ